MSDKTPLPERELRDPRELRALAHPVRLSLMEGLARLGPSTATELSQHLGDQSPANCSWHLRHLARYGFIEEAGTGPGRQRRWRIVPESTTVRGTPHDPPETVLAADAFDDLLLERALVHRREWQRRRREEPEEWRAASFANHSWFWLTDEELAELAAEQRALIERLIEKAMGRLDPANRPPGSRAVQMMAWAVPVGPEHEPSEDQADQGGER